MPLLDTDIHLRAAGVLAAALLLVAQSSTAQELGAPAPEDKLGALIEELSGDPNYEDLKVVVIVAAAPTVVGSEHIKQALEYASEAVSAFDNGDPERATTMASLAIDSGMLTRRDLAVVYRNRGTARAAMRDLDAAIRDFSSAVTYRPDYAGGYAARAAALIRTGAFDAALEDLDAALTLDPNLPAASYNRYLLRMRQGDESGAAYDLLQAYLADKENETYTTQARALGLIPAR